jgi:hypothetical protein
MMTVIASMTAVAAATAAIYSGEPRRCGVGELDGAEHGDGCVA